MALLILVSNDFRRWTYVSIHTALVITLCSTYIEVNMYTFILYINTWTLTYMYQLHLLSFSLVYMYDLSTKHQYLLWDSLLSSYKAVSVLHNLVTRLLQSCWFYTTLFNLDNLAATLIFQYGKYTAWGEIWVSNIAQCKAECYICHETLTKCCIFHIKEAAVLWVLYCILYLKKY